VTTGLDLGEGLRFPGVFRRDPRG